MVAETKEGMTQMFDTMTEGVRTSFETGRKIQDSLFGSMGNAFNGQNEFVAPFAGSFAGPFATPEFFTKNWMPFVNENVQAANDCADAGVKSGMNVFKAACDTVVGMDEGDAYKRTHNFWDVAFNATRANCENVTKVSRKATEGLVSMCSCPQKSTKTNSTKADTKSTK